MSILTKCLQENVYTNVKKNVKKMSRPVPVDFQGIKGGLCGHVNCFGNFVADSLDLIQTSSRFRVFLLQVNRRHIEARLLLVLFSITYRLDIIV